jgi:hypothetical protein
MKYFSEPVFLYAFGELGDEKKGRALNNLFIYFFGV